MMISNGRLRELQQEIADIKRLNGQLTASPRNNLLTSQVLEYRRTRLKEIQEELRTMMKATSGGDYSRRTARVLSP